MSVPLHFLTVADQDGLIAIGRDDLLRYSGLSQVVASALCLRLFARAFADLSPETPPLRRDIRVLTAFPGDGMIDGIEMITRARTMGRLTIDPAAGPEDAPTAPVGRFYFEIAIGARRRGYWLAEGYFTPDFQSQIIRHQEGDGSAAELEAYQIAKHALIGRLLGAPDHLLFHAREISP